MCQLCNTQPVYEFTNKRQVCKTCFIHWFEKKVLYTIRKFQLADRKDNIGYKKGNFFREAVIEEILKFFSQKSGAKITPLTNTNKPLKKITKITLPNTTDIEAEHFINSLINSKPSNTRLPKYKKFIKPLYLLTDEEVLLYARLKKLKFNNFTHTDSNILNTLQKNHPEVKSSVVQSYLKLFG